MAASDQDALVLAAQGGDRDAMNALLADVYDRVWAICRRLAGNDADASDATQEALIAIVRGLPKFDGRARFSTWAHRVATNACLDELRRRKRRPTPGLPDDDDGGPSQVRATDADVADTVAEQSVIDDALAELPPQFREPVVLRDYVGHDYAEIAEILDIAPGTVRSRIARGRAKLAGDPREPAAHDRTSHPLTMSDHTDSDAGDDRPQTPPGSGLFAPRSDLDADLEIVSAHLDGEHDPEVDDDAVLKALEAELDVARRAVGTEPPAGPAAMREVHLTAALAAFDELHHDQQAPIVLPTIDAAASDDSPATRSAADTAVLDQVGSMRARRVRAYAPLGAVAAVALFLVAIVAGGGLLGSTDDDTASTNAGDASVQSDESGDTSPLERDGDSFAEDAPMDDTADLDDGGASAPGIAESSGEMDDAAADDATASRAGFDRVGDLREYARQEVASDAGDEEAATYNQDQIERCPDTIATYSPHDVRIARQVVFNGADTEVVVYDEPDGLRMVAFDPDCNVLVDGFL